MMNTAQLTEELQREINFARHQLEDFQTKMKENAKYALGAWGDEAFNFAARMRVAADTLAALVAGSMVADVKKEAEIRVLRGATSPPSSASPTRNLMEQEETKAWGRLLTIIGDYDKRITTLRGELLGTCGTCDKDVFLENLKSVVAKDGKYFCIDC